MLLAEYNATSAVLKLMEYLYLCFQYGGLCCLVIVTAYTHTHIQSHYTHPSPLVHQPK